ncbi:hypothetical protein AKN88_08910 [Thiopseudomonas alkaliphila]|uniref:O-antigen/teichoic acid export membrane protein n=1 Tax=Thiopseudomonas alkaliphila TaxID=1697053 RepID=A0A0K1XF64_9GAMM|nr:oligosaccharide flippase family protein [Thiopseudomonas alkaliphila]AKX60035.1 hypothetical protein AKN88_08910 [Thiopseudomonas alkaliphila]
MKSAIRSVSLLSISSLLGSGSTFLIYLILARALTVNDYGLFTSVLSLVTALVFFASFGIPQTWLKIFGEKGWEGVNWVRPSIEIVCFLALMISVFLVFAYFREGGFYFVVAIILYFLGQVFLELVIAKKQLEEKFLDICYWQIIPNFSRLLLVFIFSYQSFYTLNITTYAYLYGIIGGSIFLFCILDLKKFFKEDFELKGHKKESKSCEKITKTDAFNESWPFALNLLFSYVYLQSNLVLVKYLSGNEQAAYYNAAFVMLTAMLTIPNIIYSKFLLPKIHRWANSDFNMFYSVFIKGVCLMFFLGGGIGGFTYYFSDNIILLVFGEEYFSAIPILKVISLSMPVIFLSYSFSSTLVTRKNIKIKTLYMGLTATFNIFLGSFFIYKYQALGAAYTTLATYSFLLFLYIIANIKYVFRK